MFQAAELFSGEKPKMREAAEKLCISYGRAAMAKDSVHIVGALSVGLLIGFFAGHMMAGRHNTAAISKGWSVRNAVLEAIRQSNQLSEEQKNTLCQASVGPVTDRWDFGQFSVWPEGDTMKAACYVNEIETVHLSLKRVGPIYVVEEAELEIQRTELRDW